MKTYVVSLRPSRKGAGFTIEEGKITSTDQPGVREYNSFADALTIIKKTLDGGGEYVKKLEGEAEALRAENKTLREEVEAASEAAKISDAVSMQLLERSEAVVAAAEDPEKLVEEIDKLREIIKR